MSAKGFCVVHRSYTNRIVIILCLVVVVFWLGGCNRDNGPAMRYASTSADPPNSGAPAAPAANSTMVVSYADVVSRTSPAVITIHSQMRARAPQQYPSMDDPLFRQFFGDRTPQQVPELKREALGSGVI